MIQAQHLLKNPHHSSGKLLHPKIIDRLAEFFLLSIRKALFQQIIIVYELPQSDSLIKEMTHHMRQQENGIETIRWCTNMFT